MQLDLIANDEGKLIRYKDNGVGVDMDSQGHRLFQPFERINENEKTEGTGVGLFIVRKLIQAYGVQLMSKVDQERGFYLNFFFQSTDLF